MIITTSTVKLFGIILQDKLHLEYLPLLIKTLIKNSEVPLTTSDCRSKFLALLTKHFKLNILHPRSDHQWLF